MSTNVRTDDSRHWRSSVGQHGWMPIDVEQARADTPGCRQVVHLNNAGASLPPQVVLDTQLERLQHEAVTGATRSRPTAGRFSTQRTTRSPPSSVPHPMRSLSSRTPRSPGTRRSGRCPSNRPAHPHRQRGVRDGYTSMLQAQHRRGAEIVVIPDDEHGQVSVDALADLLHRHGRRSRRWRSPTCRRTAGWSTPPRKSGDLRARQRCRICSTHVSQWGQMPVDVEAIGCDMLSATGRKFREPRGTGSL